MEAMTYTKDKALIENRETVVRFWLNTNTRVSYIVEIHYASAFEAWSFTISNEADESVGEIVSDKWPFLQILFDEDVETQNANVHAQTHKSERE